MAVLEQTHVSEEAEGVINSPPNALSIALHHGRLLTAREVAARLGVSERWVRDHTTRRSPKIRGLKLGTLIRYRISDVDEFLDRLGTCGTSRMPRFDG